MERRNSIRAAIQGLLTQVPHTDEDSLSVGGRPLHSLSLTAAAAVCACAEGFSGPAFSEIQAELRARGISAEAQEIAHAVLEVISRRPALCRGLLAEYLLEET